MLLEVVEDELLRDVELEELVEELLLLLDELLELKVLEELLLKVLELLLVLKVVELLELKVLLEELSLELVEELSIELLEDKLLEELNSFSQKPKNSVSICRPAHKPPRLPNVLTQSTSHRLSLHIITSCSSIFTPGFR